MNLAIFSHILNQWLCFHLNLKEKPYALPVNEIVCISFYLFRGTYGQRAKPGIFFYEQS